MSDLTKDKHEANKLRKAGNFEEALPLYRNLWKETGDGFDGAGLLHCLRKLKLFDEAMELFVKTATDLAGDEKIESIIGGLTGVVEPEDGRLTFAPHTPDWLGKSFVKAVSTALDAPVYVKNDAVMVGLGEAIYGAGRGSKIMMYMTVSTGVGGARIVDGFIDSGASGFEPGHQLIGLGEDSQALEDYVSGSAVEKRLGKKALDRKSVV